MDWYLATLVPHVAPRRHRCRRSDLVVLKRLGAGAFGAVNLVEPGGPGGKPLGKWPSRNGGFTQRKTMVIFHGFVSFTNPMDPAVPSERKCLG